jgi:ferredoxin
LVALPSKLAGSPALKGMETRSILALREGARLRLNEGACLPLRSHFGGCRACAAVCPTGVLSVAVEQVELAEGCTNCGRCVAACPNDALQIDGFEPLRKLPAGTEPIELECAKVPARARSAGAIVVPCLGGISAGRLAELNERAGGREVQLIDRGWCAQCKAGCSATHPAKPAVDAVALWLHAIDETAAAPRIVSRPLPLALMPTEIPLAEAAPDPGPVMTRRQFFRTLAESPTGWPRTPMGANGRAAFPASKRRQSPERRRLLEALEAAAKRRGGQVPAEFFPRVTNNGACADHRVCTAACPTGALVVVADDGATTLTFAAAACIGCGACTRACPEGALALDAHGGSPTPTPIASHVQSACTACGEAFAARAGETVCLACSKSQRFIRDAMTQLFGARH